MRRLRTRVAQRDLGSVERTAPPIPRPETGARGGMRLFAGLLLVSAVIASTIVIRLHRSQAITFALQTGSPTHAVIILIDGAQPGDIAAPRLPNLSRLIRNGVSYNSAWIGQLQASPASSAATVGTGVFPREHGIVGPTWTDQATGQETNVLSPGQVHVGSLDQLMESRNIPTLAGVLKQQDASQRILSVGGVGCAPAAAAATWLADYVLCPARDGNRWGPAGVTGHLAHSAVLQSFSWVQPVALGRGLAPNVEGWQLGGQDNWIGRYTVAAMRATHPAVTIVDFPEIGLVTPYVSAEQRTTVAGRLMRGIDAAIGTIVAELKYEHVYNRTVFAVTSGLVTTPFTDAISTASLQTAITASASTEVYQTTDASAMIGLQDSTQSQPLAQTLQVAGLPSVDAIFYKVHGTTWTYQEQYVNPDLPAGFGDVAQYLLGTMASDAAPDVVVVYAPHVGTQTGLAGFPRQESTLGLQWDTQHIPLVLSGYGIFQGGNSDYPARLVDIAPTVEALLGLRPDSIDGIVLSDAMLVPPEGSVDRLSVQKQQVVPLVVALKRRFATSSG
jgi:Type I phosphodiesterase / nucleotide pyrophosphatase